RINSIGTHHCREGYCPLEKWLPQNGRSRSRMSSHVKSGCERCISSPFSREPSTNRPAFTRPPRSLDPHDDLRQTAWSPSRFRLLSLGLRNPIGHQLQRGSLTHYLVLVVDLHQLLMHG